MNENIIKVFKHEQFGKIRIVDEKGEQWFVARDIAEALGYKNVNRDIQRHCKGGTETVLPTTDGSQITKIIPESDFYRLIMRSKLPSAEKFQDGVIIKQLNKVKFI